MSMTSDINTEYQKLVADHKSANQGNDPGMLSRIRYSVLAAAIWGLRKQHEGIRKSAHPLTDDMSAMREWAKDYGVFQLAQETDSDFRARFEDYLQHPPAGGNQYDWQRWAKEETYIHNPGASNEWLERCSDARYRKNARGVGTIDLVVVSHSVSDGNECELSSELSAQIIAAIEDKRPGGSSDWELVNADPFYVSIQVTAPNLSQAERDAMKVDIVGYVNTYRSGDRLSTAQITGIALNHGCENPEVLYLPDDIFPTMWQVVRTTVDRVTVLDS